MAVITYPNGQSTLTWGGYTFQHLMEGEALNLAPANERTSRTNSMSGGVSVTNRIDAGVHNLTIMVQRNSPDYDFMEGVKIQASPFVADGSMKRAYSRDGTSLKESKRLISGSITTQSTIAENNQDPDSSISYVIQFRDVV